MVKERVAYLLERYQDGKLSASEKLELTAIINEGGTDLEPVLAKLIEIIDEVNFEADEARKQQMYEQIQARIREESSAGIVHRIQFFKRTWIRYAAAIIIIFGIGAYLWTINKKTEQALAVGYKPPSKADVLPGGDKAILTLADGSKIVLDSAANGSLAKQGNAAIIKLANGQIAYDLKGLAQGDLMMNTMATPKGGQYRLVLPDGSKAWLNAASSIQFPAVFVGAKRSVKITGEVYFEIVKNKEKPFIVDVDGKMNVQVLGTSFNINSYEDEGNIKATLVEGSVKVTRGAMSAIASSDRQQTTNSPSEVQSVILSPGQQAQTFRTSVNPGIRVSFNVDIDQTLAWKNGIFNFNGLSVREVMAQLSRWYDVDVRYEGPVPTNIFRGEMYRNAKLSFVLTGLQELGIKCKMDGKTLIVMK